MNLFQKLSLNNKSMKKINILRNCIIYFLLIIGYIYLYVVDIDILINPEKEQEVKSTVEFVYSQF
jgi:hypothetical protein